MALSPRHKRRQLSEDSEEGEGSGSPSKRPRQEQNIRRGVEDEDVDFHGEGRGLNGNSGRKGKGREREDSTRDGESESDADDYDSEPEMEEDQEENLKAYEEAKARKRLRFGTTAQAGIIKSITVVDFMNHRHTTVDYGPKINFIVGHNGSGKSAILTAIAVALGGKTAITGRGSSMKDLIRKGSDKAVITLTLTNAGPEAFKPEMYNPCIIIERSILSSGGSSYKFRASRDGKTLANKREELTEIVQHFKLTVDSPLTILTQDAARSFLQNSTPKTLYSFFKEGTGLKQLAEEYSVAAQHLQTLELLQRQRAEAEPELMARVERLKEMVAASEKLIELRARLARLRTEAAWAYVIEKEMSRDGKITDLEKHKAKAAAIQKEISKCEAELQPVAEQCVTLQEEFDRFKQTQEHLEKERKKAKGKQIQAKDQVRQAEAALQETVDKIVELKDDAANLERKIRAKESAQNDTEDPAQVALRNDIRKHEEALKKFLREVPVKEDSVRHHEQAVNQAEARENRSQGEIRQVEEDINKGTGTLRNLERQSTDRLSAFGQNLEGVLATINKEKWKHSKPIGPLGLYVHLEDEHYKGIISAQLGMSLCGFAVRCKEDRIKLTGILSEHNRRHGYKWGPGNVGIPNVFQHNGERFDYAEGDHSRFGETVLSKLRFDNEDVLRVLITEHNIERYFLAPTLRRGNEMVEHLRRAGVATPTVLCADHFRTAGTSTGNKDSAPVPFWKGFVLFTRNVAGAIAEQRRLLDEQKGGRERLKQAHAAAQGGKAEAAKALAQVQQQLRDAKTAIVGFQRRILELNNQLEIQPDDDVFTLEGLKRQDEEEIEIYERQSSDRRKDVHSAKDLLRTFTERYEALGADYEKFASDRTEMQTALEAVLQKQAELEHGLRHYRRSMSDTEIRVENAKNALEQDEAEIQIWMRDAEKTGPRVETSRRPKEAEDDLASTKKAIEIAERRSNQSTEVIMRDYRSAVAALKETRKANKDFRRFNDILEKSLAKRQTWWKKQRQSTAWRAKTVFISNLVKRNFDGRLEFDHGEEKLYVLIDTSTSSQRSQTQTQATGVQSTFRTAANLSGGEKSFSTVALLLSMWETMDGPIKCLDEWDVFLDGVNRGVAARALIDGAKESGISQFILITPQSMSGVAANGPETQIVRLNDPERNQGTIGFAPASAPA